MNMASLENSKSIKFKRIKIELKIDSDSFKEIKRKFNQQCPLKRYN